MSDEAGTDAEIQVPDPSTIAERRRRRRAAERRRRSAIRRRNALAITATIAFAIGIAMGAAGDPSPVATPGARADSDPVPPPTVTGFGDPVPVLMYHAIGEPPPDAAYPELFVPPDEFRDQIRGLSDDGYNAVTLTEVFAAWREDEPIAVNPVVVSFDDGLRSQFAEGLPELRRLAWPGVLNLKVESLEQGELTDGMVREMLDAGWELASHTVSHTDVTTLDPGALRSEVAGSRQTLARRFGVDVSFFCYPGGSYDDDAIAAVDDAGYVGATTTDPGLASPGEPFTLKRIRVDGGDGIEGLRAKLAGAGAGAGGPS